MRRFYSPTINLESKTGSITDPNEIHHICNVLRLKIFDSISIFDGKCIEAIGKIISIQPQKIDIQIKMVTNLPKEGPRIILACSIPKKGKFETIIEKTTELGVSEIIPLKTERTEVILTADRLHKKILRYQSVGINAAKQSKRISIPKIHTVTTFVDAINSLKERSEVFIPSLSGKRDNLKDALPPVEKAKCISFFIGPEGDFTPKEYALAEAKGCRPVSLGETILKVETAAIVVVAFTQLFYNK